MVEHDDNRDSKFWHTAFLPTVCVNRQIGAYGWILIVVLAVVWEDKHVVWRANGLRFSGAATD